MGKVSTRAGRWRSDSVALADLLAARSGVAWTAVPDLRLARGVAHQDGTTDPFQTGFVGSQNAWQGSGAGYEAARPKVCGLVPLIADHVSVPRQK